MSAAELKSLIPLTLRDMDLLDCHECGWQHRVSAQSFRLYDVRWLPCDKCGTWLPTNACTLHEDS